MHKVKSMKKLISIAALLLVVLALLAGCSSAAEEPKVPEAPSQQQVPEAPLEENPEETPEETPEEPETQPIPTDSGYKAQSLVPEGFAWAEGLPPELDGDLQVLYNVANALYINYKFGCSNVAYDVCLTNDLGHAFYRDCNFMTYGDFEAAVYAVFTPEFAADFLESARVMQSPEGYLFSGEIGMGSNIDYLRTEYTLLSADENEIQLQVIGVYNEGTMEAYPNEPDPAGNYTNSKTVLFRATPDGWRLDYMWAPSLEF